MLRAVPLITLAALCFAPSPLAAQRAVTATFPAAGMLRRGWIDTNRPAWGRLGPRPLATTVWYPADTPDIPDTLTMGPPGQPLFVAGVVARNASFANHAAHPLILLSHGTGGSALQLAWLGIALARRGYVVAAVDHHGNTAAEPAYDPRGFTLWWERAIDLSVVLDLLLADSTIGPRVDRNRIGAAGFSIGGYTVLALAGGRTSLVEFDAFCASAERDATCGAQAEMPDALNQMDLLMQSDSAVQRSMAHAGDQYRDDRIRAVVTLAPAVMRAVPAASLRSIVVPMLIIAGDSDEIAPALTNARHVAGLVPHARFRLFRAVGHYTFLSSCTARGRTILPDLCHDAPGVDRDAIHTRAAALIADFFDATLALPR